MKYTHILDKIQVSIQIHHLLSEDYGTLCFFINPQNTTSLAQSSLKLSLLCSCMGGLNSYMANMYETVCLTLSKVCIPHVWTKEFHSYRVLVNHSIPIQTIFMQDMEWLSEKNECKHIQKLWGSRDGRAKKVPEQE